MATANIRYSCQTVVRQMFEHRAALQAKRRTCKSTHSGLTVLSSGFDQVALLDSPTHLFSNALKSDLMSSSTSIKVNNTSWKITLRKLDSLKVRRNSRQIDDDSDCDDENDESLATRQRIRSCQRSNRKKRKRQSYRRFLSQKFSVSTEISTWANTCNIKTVCALFLSCICKSCFSSVLLFVFLALVPSLSFSLSTSCDSIQIIIQ
jgi:hypothetical protein